ncbi:MAG: flippase-like domain-containing protein [Dehalococcoidia bacterium]|nr:flippase-like domain-containing protein [Dehalococcoidia bacterium]
MRKQPDPEAGGRGARRPALGRGKRRLLRVVASPWLFEGLLLVGLLALAYFEIDLHQVAIAFKTARYEFLIAVFAVYVFSRILHAIEWRIALTKVGRAPLLGLFGVLLIGTLVNTVVPASAGDVAKVQIAANRYNLPRAGLVATRGAEAVVNAIMMLVFVALAFALPGASVAPRVLLWLMVAATITLFLVAEAASLLLPEQLPHWRILRPLPERSVAWLRFHWPRFHAGLELIRRPRLLGVTLLLNLVGWGEDVLMIWLYALAFHLALPFGAYVSVAVAVALITTFPVTVGNIGAYEFLVTGVLALYGAGSASALAYAIGTHVFGIVFNVILGLLAVRAMRLRPRDVFQIAQSSKPSQG